MYVNLKQAEFNYRLMKIYCIYPKQSVRQAFANSVDPDQTSQNLVNDQDEHWLPLL